jgi:hypothetical protein
MSGIEANALLSRHPSSDLDLHRLSLRLIQQVVERCGP